MCPFCILRSRRSKFPSIIKLIFLFLANSELAALHLGPHCLPKYLFAGIQNEKLLTEHHFEFLSLMGGYTGSSESKLVKMPHCWKSHVAAHIMR